MFKLRIKVGRYYTFTLGDEHTIAFAVLYGFESGKKTTKKPKNVWDMTIDDKINTTENRFYVYP